MTMKRQLIFGSLIMTKTFLRLASLAYFCLFFVTPSHAESKPNFVFIIADDCTFRDIGVYGGQAKTPNIDQLATEGIRMTHCFQAAPMCSPTRHNIYTGQYPVKTGAYPNHTQTYRNVKNITHYLKPLGYRTALSGKTHIGPKEIFNFEYTAVRNNPDLKAISTLFAECNKTDTPFCLFACSNEPHSPWNKGDSSQYPPEKVILPPYIADTPVVRENFSRYLAEITYFDQQVGEILELIDQHDLRDDTLVMVVSEQGNAFPFAKWTCYDSGLQSAMIVRWPDKIEAGRVTDAMVEYSDVTPTFVDLAGGERADELDGMSMKSLLLGDTDQHKDYVFGEMTTKGIINGSDCYPIRSVRSRQFKLIRNFSHETKFTNACTKHEAFQSMVAAAEAGDKKAADLVHKYHWRPEIELYDVINDPLEMNNLAGNKEHADEISKLSDKLKEWMKQQGDTGIETELSANSHKKKQKRTK